MRYQTKIVGRVVEVISARTGVTYTYQILPGLSPALHALRCTERVRVGECLAAI